MPMALNISKKSHWGTKSDPHSLPLTYLPRVSPLPDVVPFPSRDVWERCCWKDSLTLGLFSPSPQEMMEIPGILIRERGELRWCQSWRVVARGMRAALLCSWRWITSKRRLLQIQRWSQPSGTGPRRETGSLVPEPKQPQVFILSSFPKTVQHPPGKRFNPLCSESRNSPCAKQRTLLSGCWAKHIRAATSQKPK